MAEALISVLLEQLVSVSSDHTNKSVKLILNAETEVKKFSSNLKAIQAVLEDAEQQQVENAIVRNWLNGLNDVSYEMADVLDVWNTEIMKQKAMGVITTEKKQTFIKKVCFSIASTCFCVAQVNRATYLYRIATEITELNEKLALISAQKKQFKFHESSTRSRDNKLIKSLKTSSFVNIATIFGREEATADLLSKLLSENSEEGKRISVIPIVGMGGMGKTTLAQLAFNNKNVRDSFKKRIWVCVSDPFDVVRIAKAIISGTGNGNPDSTEFEDVLQCMSRCLEGKKILIILDDVWTEYQEEWESLKLPIIMETSCAKGSKIVVTTRKERVAEVMGATTHMIHLEKLSEENCLALFNSIAYLGREEDKANGFGAIGEKIAKKCKGLPLAARALGTLMHSKKKRGEWEDVLESKIWQLQEVEQQIFQPLLLSYYELAPVVKRCLLYCATFPKDYRMKKHNLIKLWMSHDYLSGKDYKEKEKTGQTVFETLVMRSFFQDFVEEEIDYWHKGMTIFCKIHDIVHDFLQFLNKNECFIMEAKEANGRISEEVRHLSLMYAQYGSPLSDLISAVNCKKLRSLAAFESRMRSTDLQAISQVKCLRTLNLSSNRLTELPEEIGELIHLRYLDLARNWELVELPDSLGNLYNLQTLDLTGCFRLRRLPESIGNLINLRHLHNHGLRDVDYLPRGMARLTNLQTLNVCMLVNDGKGLELGDLGNLDQLQGTLKIVIDGSLNDAVSEAQKARLWNKKLCHLEIYWSVMEGQSEAQFLEALRPHEHLERLSIGPYFGSPAPSWMISLQNLRSLSLSTCGSNCLPPLGSFPFLEEFSVFKAYKVKRVGDEFLGSQTSSSSVSFPKLKKLTFELMREWEQWEESGGAGITIMPCLESLEVNDCPKLKNLPLFLQNTPLTKIKIESCRRGIKMPAWPDNCNVVIRYRISEARSKQS